MNVPAQVFAWLRRKHCRNRLSKLRQHLKFHHGRHKFQKKELSINMITDARWAQAVEFACLCQWVNQVTNQIDNVHPICLICVIKCDLGILHAQG